MIAKILKSGTFADVVGYVMRQFHDPEKYTPDTWRVIDTDGILGDSYRQICNSFDLGHSLNKRKSDPARHIAVSFDKKDLLRLTDEFMVQLAKEYMEKMGILDTQYIIVRHFEIYNPRLWRRRYRYFRTSFQDDDGQKYLINTERDFYRGTRQEQDSIKDYIRWREQHYGLDKTFLHFYPTEE